MEKKIIYANVDLVEDESKFNFDVFNFLTSEEKLKEAELKGMDIYDSVEAFAEAFNNGYISDLGYMFVV